MPKPSRNQIYDAVIRRMVSEALEEGEREFAREHENDPDEALLTILTDTARALGHSPWPGEFPGGTVIRKRFGTWDTALRRAGLNMPTHANKVERFPRVQEEIQRQKESYRQRKAEKKRKSQQRLQARQEARPKEE